MFFSSLIILCSHECHVFLVGNLRTPSSDHRAHTKGNDIAQVQSRSDDFSSTVNNGGNMVYLICGGKQQMVMTVVVLDSKKNKKKAAVIEHTTVRS